MHLIISPSLSTHVYFDWRESFSWSTCTFLLFCIQRWSSVSPLIFYHPDHASHQKNKKEGRFSCTSLPFFLWYERRRNDVMEQRTSHHDLTPGAGDDEEKRTFWLSFSRPEYKSWNEKRKLELFWFRVDASSSLLVSLSTSRSSLHYIMSRFFLNQSKGGKICPSFPLLILIRIQMKPKQTSSTPFCHSTPHIFPISSWFSSFRSINMKFSCLPLNPSSVLNWFIIIHSDYEVLL